MVPWSQLIGTAALQMDLCPVKLYQWYRTENDTPAVDMTNATSNGLGIEIL
jgi:hypothetical protein